MSRLIVVSNRVSPPTGRGGESVGGLAMALAAALREFSGLWFGWSGRTTPEFNGHLNLQRGTGLDSMLFITEGLSAAGSITSSRDVNTQAVFTLRGKPLNVCDLKRDALYKNVEIYNLMQSLDIEETVKYMGTVQQMVPIAKTCKGKFSTNLTMNAVLDQHMQPDLNTLSGHGTLRTKSVRVEGFQPLVDIAKAFKIKQIPHNAFYSKDGQLIFSEPGMVDADMVETHFKKLLEQK